MHLVPAAQRPWHRVLHMGPVPPPAAAGTVCALCAGGLLRLWSTAALPLVVAPLARALFVSAGRTGAVAHPGFAHVHVTCAVRQSPLLASTARVTPLLRCSPAS